MSHNSNINNISNHNITNKGTLATSSKNNNSNNNNSNGRKNKLSSWMRKIMQSNGKEEDSSSTVDTQTYMVPSTSKVNSNLNSIPLYGNSKNRNISKNKVASINNNGNNGRSKSFIIDERKIQNHSHSQPISPHAVSTNHSEPESDAYTINSSLKPIFNKDDKYAINDLEESSVTMAPENSIKTDSSAAITSINCTNTYNNIHKKNNNTNINNNLRLQWDQEPERIKSDIDDADSASMAPLLSFCSSSVKSSSMFSDCYSIQSTRPTVMSTRTLETYSSTVPIPPASIMDRARPSNSTAFHGGSSVYSSSMYSISNYNNSNNNNNSNLHSISNTSSHVPTTDNTRQLQRHNSTHTINSIITIKS